MVTPLGRPPIPLSIQLFTLRSEMEKSPLETLRRVSEIGFEFVEPAGFFGYPPREFRRMVEDLGMRIGSSHTPWATDEEPSRTIDMAGELGICQVVGGFTRNRFADLNAVRRTAEEVNRRRETLASAGLELVLHNHWWEFAPLESQLAMDHLLAECPSVALELDLYWAAHFGDNDVPALMRRLRERIRLLHVKDGDFSREPVSPLLPLGEGKMKLPGCLREADPARVGFLVFEMDRCAADLWTAVEKSFHTLQGWVPGSSTEGEPR